MTLLLTDDLATLGCANHLLLPCMNKEALMSEGINLHELNALAERVADSVCSIIGGTVFSTPRFNDETCTTNATNSLDEDYLADLIAGKHLDSKRLDSYYSNLTNA